MDTKKIKAVVLVVAFTIVLCAGINYLRHNLPAYISLPILLVVLMGAYVWEKRNRSKAKNDDDDDDVTPYNGQ